MARVSRSVLYPARQMLGGFGFFLVFLGAICAVRAESSDVIFNEILYDADPTNSGGEFLEFFNRGDTSLDLSGWSLANAVSFTFEDATTIEAGGYLVVVRNAEEALAFYGVEIVGEYSGRLDNAGETIDLLDAHGDLVDRVTYEDELPWPPEADGGGPSLELFDPLSDNGDPSSWGLGQDYSPGAANVPTSSDGGPIVFSEIMYKPRREELREKFDGVNAGFYMEDGDDLFGEYVELFNRSDEVVDLSGWTISDGVGYEFPEGTRLEPGASIAVGVDPEIMKKRLGDDLRILGPFSGKLDDGGERLTLRDSEGLTIDSVRFNDRYPWPLAPDEFGVSLEVRDPFSDNTTAANWGSSVADPFPAVGSTRRDPSQNPEEWHYFAATVKADTTTLLIFADGASEWLIDEVSVGYPGGAPNRITEEGSFDGGDSDWAKLGNHADSSWTDQDAREGTGSMRLVATGKGSPRNAITLKANPRRVVRMTNFEISCWVKYVSGAPGLTFTFLGATDRVSVPADIFPDPPVRGFLGQGTPGAPNSVDGDGVPPLVHAFDHFPETPSSTDEVTVSARITSASALRSVMLFTSLDIYEEVTEVEMFDDGRHNDGERGDGIFAAQLSAHPSPTIVHYRVHAEDVDGRITTFPYEGDASPTRAYCHFDNDSRSKLTSYFLAATSVTQAAMRRGRSKEYFDASMAIDGIAYPHIGLRLRGRGSRSSGKQYKFRFNRDKLYKGNRVLDTMTAVPFKQRVGFMIFDEAGIENLQSDLVTIHLNRRNQGLYVVFEVPNAHWLKKRGYDASGEIYKARTVETHGRARESDLFRHEISTDYDYWGVWNKKVRPLERPSHIRDLTDNLNDLPIEDLLPWMDAHIDIDQWLTRWSLYVLMVNQDFGDHNYYMFLPGEPGGKWQQLAYDLDHVLRVETVAPSLGSNRFNNRVWRNPTLKRVYMLHFRRVIDELYPLEERLFPMIDELASQSGGNDRGMKRGLEMQRGVMQGALRRERLPTKETAPQASIPGGEFADPVSVTLSVPEGWQAYLTLDGSDPRLSKTRKEYVEAIMIDASSVLRAAAISTPVDFESGNWTDATEHSFKVGEPVQIPFVRGDVNGDARLNVTDAVALLHFLFGGDFVPSCARTADTNANDRVSTDDVIYLIRYLYANGSRPETPFPECGVVESSEGPQIDCVSYAPCDR